MKGVVRILCTALILGALGSFILELLRPSEPTLPGPIVIEGTAKGDGGPRSDRRGNNGGERVGPRSGNKQSNGEVPEGGAAPVAPPPPCPAGEDEPGEDEDDCDDGHEDLDEGEDDEPDERDGDDD
jgi:hypothetical protein